MSIGVGAFAYCNSLESIIVENDNKYYISINNILYSKSQENLLCIPAGQILVDYTIPNNVTKISEYAFCGCSSLESIKIQNSVKSIGAGAFANCNSLTSIVIPNSVTKIEEVAFDGCASLKSIVFPESNLSIGKNAFRHCNSLTNIHISVTTPECFYDLQDWGITEEQYTSINLYVPAGTRWAYRHHPVFGKFKNIEIESNK